MYSDGLKKVRYLDNQQPSFVFIAKQLFNNKNRKGSTTRRMCKYNNSIHIFPRMPEFNNKVFIKFRLNINTYKIIYI